MQPSWHELRRWVPTSDVSSQLWSGFLKERTRTATSHTRQISRSNVESVSLKDWFSWLWQSVGAGGLVTLSRRKRLVHGYMAALRTRMAGIQAPGAQMRSTRKPPTLHFRTWFWISCLPSVESPSPRAGAIRGVGCPASLVFRAQASIVRAPTFSDSRPARLVSQLLRSG